MFLFLRYFQISFGICSTAKLSKYVTFLACIYKEIQLVSIDSYLSRFVIYASSVILGKLFLE